VDKVITQPRRNTRLAKAFLLTLLSAGLSVPQRAMSSASNSPSLEYEVKAAFLLNFTKFIDWPASETAASDDPFVICILGDDPFGAVLDRTFEGEEVNGRKVMIQRLGHTMSKGCQVLYVSRAEKGIRELLGAAPPGTLTVGEGEAFVKDGGMIAFVLDNRRVRFNINLSAARNGRLTLSSRLLAVAKSVEK
jgi:hypothetical protein